MEKLGLVLTKKTSLLNQFPWWRSSVFVVYILFTYKRTERRFKQEAVSVACQPPACEQAQGARHWTSSNISSGGTLYSEKHILVTEGAVWGPGPCVVRPPPANRHTDRYMRLKTLPLPFRWRAVTRKVTHYKRLGLSQFKLLSQGLPGEIPPWAINQALCETVRCS